MLFFEYYGLSTRTNNSRSYNPLNSSAHSNNNKGQRKERPFCTHCNYHRHTVDKCYKLHGYPPGYKPKMRTTSATINQVSTQSASNDNGDQDTHGVGNFIKNLNVNQYQHLMSILSTHMHSAPKSPKPQPNIPSTSYSACICFSIALNPMFASSKFWIMDSGASKHICADGNSFLVLQPISNTSITLPNNSQIRVNMVVDVQINPQIFLKNVLFVPQIHFNLLFVSALTTDSSLDIHFIHDHFIIQDPHHKKMIGRGNKQNDLYTLD